MIVNLTNFDNDIVCRLSLDSKNNIEYQGQSAAFIKKMLEDEHFYYFDGKKKHNLSLKDPKELLSNLYMVITGTALRASKPIFDDDGDGENIKKSLDSFINKAKIYLERNGKAPEGSEIETGPRGGRYYEGKAKVVNRPSRYPESTKSDEGIDFIKNYVAMTSEAFKREPPEGFHYSSIDHFVKENGKGYSGNVQFTDNEQKTIKALMNFAGKMQKQACFRNSALLTMMSSLLDSPDKIEYVEGYGLKKGLIPLMHAWITINGKVYDSTWSEQKTTFYYGVPFSPEEVTDMHVNKKRTTAGMIDAYEIDFPYLKQKREYGKVLGD